MTTTSTPADAVSGIIAAFGAQVNDPAEPLALVARFRVRAGGQEPVERAFAAAARETRKEAGALAYALHREAGDPGVFVVYERWRSLGDLEAHLRTPYITELREVIDAVLDGDPDFRVLLPA